MTTRKVPKTELKTYFDRVRKVLRGRSVEIEVASLDLGDQIEANWVTMNGIIYDERADTIDFTTDKLDHRITKPEAVHVLEAENGLEAIEVERRDGTKEIIRLRMPLLLPAPAA